MKRRFEELLEYIRGLEHRDTGWEYEDPGAVLLELFTMLALMQRVYLDYQGDRWLEVFVKLLGETRKKMEYARGPLEFYQVKQAGSVPAGSRFFAGEIPFETMETTTLTTNEIHEALTENRGRFYHHSLERNSSFYPFGKTADEGSALYLGFSQDIGKNFVESVYVEPTNFSGMAERRKQAGCVSLGQIQCAALCRDSKEGAVWQDVSFSDHTCCFAQRGHLRLAKKDVSAAGEMISCDSSRFTGKAAGQQLYWLRFTLRESNFEKGPSVRFLALNTVLAEQKHSWEEIAFSSDGQPCQQFVLDQENLDENRLQVKVKHKSGEWRCWKAVNHLEQAAPGEEVYCVKEGRLRFGNGEEGMVPPAGSENIRVKLVCSLGAEGAVQACPVTAESGAPGQVEGLTDQVARLAAETSGGSNKETWAEAFQRAALGAGAVGRLVTLEDYETMAKQSPGLDIDLVKARWSEQSGQVEIVVKPNSFSLLPGLKSSWLTAIKEYLEPARLLGTRILVRGPRYVEIFIRIRAEASSDPLDVERKLRLAVCKLVPEKEKTGEHCPDTFGMLLSWGGMMKVLSRVTGVKRIQMLKLEAEAGGERKPGGDIQLPEDALAYLGAVEIDVV